MERANDYLYDPLYTVCSLRDHLKAIKNAQKESSRVVIIPNYENMFSQFPTHPARSFELQYLPIFDNYSFQPKNIIDNNPQVVGANRYKYFRIPIVPNGESQFVTPHVVQLQQPEPKKEQKVKTQVVEVQKIKNIGIQSQVRESEAQTLPYSPEYVVVPSENEIKSSMEILSLASLAYKAGLPVGLAEIEMIERARAKRAWEKTLPPASGGKSQAAVMNNLKRMQMLQEMELREWADREREIQHLQQRRLKVLEHLINERAKNLEETSNTRLLNSYNSLMLQRQQKMAKLKSKRAKLMRNLLIKHKPETKKDIISEYGNFASNTLLPRPRDGIPIHLQSLKIRGDQEVKININHNVPSSNLEKEKKLIKPPSLPFYEPVSPKFPEPNLELLDSLLKEDESILPQFAVGLPKFSIKETQEKQIKPPRFLVELPKTYPRPQTPSILNKLRKIDHDHYEFSMDNQGNETFTEDDQEAIGVQRYMRGRHAQLQMLDGVKRRLPLISELRLDKSFKEALESIQSEDDYEPKEILDEFEELNETEANILRNKNESQQLISEKLAEKIFSDCVQPEFIGQYLDFVDKEIYRLREERRLNAIAKLAERMRYMREAQEAGRRQQELKDRNLLDQKFKQIMNIHHETVDSYLEEIIYSSIDDASSMKAKNVTRLCNGFTKATEATLSDKETIQMLVSSFLVPQAERKITRLQIENSQQKYMAAAHREILSSLPQIQTDKQNLESQNQVLEKEMDLKEISLLEQKINEI